MENVWIPKTSILKSKEEVHSLILDMLASENEEHGWEMKYVRIIKEACSFDNVLKRDEYRTRNTDGFRFPFAEPQKMRPRNKKKFTHGELASMAKVATATVTNPIRREKQMTIAIDAEFSKESFDMLEVTRRDVITLAIFEIKEFPIRCWTRMGEQK